MKLGSSIIKAATSIGPVKPVIAPVLKRAAISIGPKSSTTQVKPTVKPAVKPTAKATATAAKPTVTAAKPTSVAKTAAPSAQKAAETTAKTTGNPPSVKSLQQSEAEIEAKKQAWLEQQAGATTTEQNRLAQQENDLLTGFENAVKAQESLTDMYDRLSKTENVPDLQDQLATMREQVSNVKGLITNLEDNINERTKGLVTEAQRQRVLAYEGTPLEKQLAALASGQEVAAGQLATAQGNVQNMMTLGTQQQEKELQPWQAKMTMFSERAAREWTGYTQDKENSLNLLLDGIQAGRSISQAEWQQASDLAKEERTYDNTIKQITYQNKLQNEQLATQQGYDMEKMAKSQGYDVSKMREQSALDLANALAQIKEQAKYKTSSTSDADWDTQFQTLFDEWLNQKGYAPYSYTSPGGGTTTGPYQTPEGWAVSKWTP